MYTYNVFFKINEYSYFEKICICSAFDDKPQNFKENFILLWLIIVTSVKINTSGGGGAWKIALCRMYMYFEHAWSRYEAVGSAFERQIEYMYM